MGQSVTVSVGGLKKFPKVEESSGAILDGGAARDAGAWNACGEHPNGRLDAMARERRSNVLADRLTAPGCEGQHTRPGAAQGYAEQAGALEKLERFSQAGHQVPALRLVQAVAHSLPK